jgi:hypothetical protein
MSRAEDQRSGTNAHRSVWIVAPPDQPNSPPCGNIVVVIERLTDMPSGTVGFRAAGEIEREDYDDVLVPELHRALQAGGGLRTLFLIEDLEEIEPGALWADSKLGLDIGVRHHEAWIRSAIVTDIEWMARATRLFAWMIPGEARVFPRGQLEAAKAWIAGDAA